MPKENQIDGFYSIAYTGIAGSGILLFLFKEGLIIGADIAGATYDGHYEISKDGSLICNIIMYIPSNTSLVTGQPPIDDEYKLEFSINLPSEFLVPKIIPLDLPTGRVNAFFRRLRTL